MVEPKKLKLTICTKWKSIKDSLIKISENKCHNTRYVRGNSSICRHEDTQSQHSMLRSHPRLNVLLTLGPEAADQFVAWMGEPSVSNVMIQLSGVQSLHNHLTWLLFPTYHRLSPDMWRIHIFRTISTISPRKENFRQIVVRLSYCTELSLSA